MTTPVRLFNNFQPEHYSLALTLQRVNRTFFGRVSINGHKPSDDRPVMLHAKDVQIHSVHMGDTAVAYELTNDTLSVNSPLAAGDYTLTVEFSGRITDAMHGLYPCYYRVDGEEKELLATQFESHHAREVFPCIDEPEAKATFDLILTTETGVTCLGNMPIKAQREADDQLVTTFATTPRMSTYLLAFVVGELHSSSAKTKDGVDVSVYSTTAQTKAGHQFALQETVRLIEHFDNYFGTAYPLPKCDQVALPDFSSLAMENWGLVTYREGYLVTHKTTPTAQRRLIATVIAHELAHQWFGNLVTMRWWDDLWLNESFANLMQYVAIDTLHPDWNIWDDFAKDESVLALSRDQFADIQPVAYTVDDPEQIAAVFDKAILYAKGSRLLRMAMHYIGDETFRAGLANYFKAHAYKNTSGSDLWYALAEVSDRDITGLMNTWLKQPGLPLVTVSKTSQGYALQQQRFSVGGEAPHANWPIPLFAADDHLPTLFATETAQLKTATLPKLNCGAVGHFLTHYEIGTSYATFDNLTDSEFIVTLFESLLLVQAGVARPQLLIHLLIDATKRPSYSVWQTCAKVLQALKQIVDAKTWNRYVSRLCLSIMGQQVDTQVRGVMGGLLVQAGEPTTVTQLSDIFHAQDKPETIDGDLQRSVFLAISLHGTPADTEQLLELHDSTTDAYLKDILSFALASSNDTTLVTQLVARLNDTQSIKPQTLPWWYAYLMQNPTAQEQTWSWLAENWSTVVSTFAGDHSLEKFVMYSAASMSTERWLSRYNEFFSTHTHPSIERAIRVGRNEIVNRTAWCARDARALTDCIRSASS